jgi:hypothetical protein
MKKYALAAAAILLAGIAAPALAGTQDFTVLNKTGHPISELYVSASAKDNWEEDVLGRDILADGDRTTIRFAGDESSCLWDIKVIYSDGEDASWQGVNLCKVSVVSLSYDADTGKTMAETD